VGAIWSQWLIRKAKTNRFLYDTNHQSRRINALALQPVGGEHIYNGFGRVNDSYTQGDIKQTWKIFGPAGRQSSKTRLEALGASSTMTRAAHRQEDALGNLSHILMTAGPCHSDCVAVNETNQFGFDATIISFSPLTRSAFTNQWRTTPVQLDSIGGRTRKSQAVSVTTANSS